MQSIKVYAVKDSMVTDYVIEKEGRFVYIYSAVEQLSASGVQVGTARIFNQLRELPETDKHYRIALETYRKHIAAVTIQEALEK